LNVPPNGGHEAGKAASLKRILACIYQLLVSRVISFAVTIAVKVSSVADRTKFFKIAALYE